MKNFLFLFIFCFLWNFQIEGKVEGKEKTICLNMIVKNESKIIKRCLDSVKDIVDYWVIIDTGSTDGTQEIIKDCMKDIPGKLYEEEWINFEHNRNSALKHAKDKADYILLLDASESLVKTQDFKKSALDKDYYYIEIKMNKLQFYQIKIVNNDLNWQWKGVLHEYVYADLAKTFDTLKNAYLLEKYEGCRSQDSLRVKKDINILKEALEKDPNNTRYTFYLAQSYRIANKSVKALKWYSKRVILGGGQEEVFYSMLQVANLKKLLSFHLDEIINSYHNAHVYQPDRVEPIFYLAEIYNRQRNFQLTYETLKAFDCISKEPTLNIMYNMDWIEEFGLLYQLSVCTYYLGKFQESINVCTKLLNNKNLFDPWRKEIEKRFKSLVNRLNDKLSILKAAYNETNNSTNQNTLDDFKYKKILLAILARDKAHVLPIYLKCIESLDYDKKYITVYINTNNNTDNTLEILEKWKDKNKDKYDKIILDHHECKMNNTNPHEWNPERFKVLGKIRNKSLKKTKEYACDYYFVVDCDNFIFPCTLKELIKKDKPIIAPMLKAIPEIDSTYSNYFCGVNEWGYSKTHPDYLKILYREKIGTFKEPLVHCTYLIKKDVIDKLSYVDETNDYEFVIFSRMARKNNIDQYICNEKKFGLILFRYMNIDPNTISNEDEKKWIQEYLEN